MFFYVSGNISVVLLSMEDQIALGFHQKHLNLCSEVKCLTSLERYESESLMTEFSFWAELTL